ncbi:MAG: thiamine pyrophosphate-dependent enzyme [Bdellovibrionota bacterium]|nr:thiamine pyrophosphate-dependent enzyme [Bdellovibrionota bacterium]
MAIQIMTGNELIIQGGLEAGFSLYTGYPGSPLADYFNILNEKKGDFQKKGIRVVIGNSEANAAAMASGAKQAGRNTLLAMKSMGLHVASDALSVGNFANPGKVERNPETGEEIYPGVVVVVGDDPWSISTSTPADSRYLYKHLHIPFLEPSTPQELKDWIKIALEISKRTSVYQGLLLTTFMAEGGGRVQCHEEVEVDKSLVHLDPEKFDLSKNVMVPPNSLMADNEMIKGRFPKVQKCLEELSLDKLMGNKDSKVGFISSGVVFENLKQILEERDLLKYYSLYKIACSYPLVDSLLLPFLKKLDALIIVEEKRGFLETELRELIDKHGLSLQIYGKTFKKDDHSEEGFPAFGGLSHEILTAKIEKVFSLLNLDKGIVTAPEFETWDHFFPKRLPTFCPGCPHRETLSLLKDLRKQLKKKDINLISHGDVGCYSLSFLEPFKEMHNLSAMGQGGALGSGVDLFTTNPSVVLMGDSTFFHSGLTDISNSVQMGHNITYILLDNDNTAMTGHQMTPISGHSVEGLKRPRQDMLPIVQGLGAETVLEVNPSDRYFYKNVLQQMVESEGVKVIISNKECGLTYHGRQKSVERKKLFKGETLKKKEFYHINSAVCEDCRECVEMTGCPGLSRTFDAYGSKVSIDPQICVADSYCTKIKACPSFELVEVSDYHPTKYKSSKAPLDLENLPVPRLVKTLDMISQGNDWRVVVTGVGGSGVTTISRILAEASREMDGRDDLDFKFMDQKGLAQRNGRVTGHLSIYRKGKGQGTVTPLGTADLLVSPDLLDGSQAISFLSESGKAIIDKDFQVPLSVLLDYESQQESLKEGKLREQISEKLGERVSLSSLKKISFDIFGKSVYASAMILGMAFQKGRIPFSEKNLEEAFRNTIHKNEFGNNWTAFGLGRKIVLEGEEAFLSPSNSDEGINYLISLKGGLLPWENKKDILSRYHEVLKNLENLFPEIKKSYLANYVHDLFVYDRGKKEDDFLKAIERVNELYKDIEERSIALRTLVRTFWIKDEVFVAHLMSTPHQHLLNEDNYSKLGSGYKVIHINRPRFDIFGKTIEFDINPKGWMLKVMRHMRIIRTLLPSWHKKEKEISDFLRKQILQIIPTLPQEKKRESLKKCENVKGYREIRYQKFDDIFGEIQS